MELSFIESILETETLRKDEKIMEIQPVQPNLTNFAATLSLTMGIAPPEGAAPPVQWLADQLRQRAGGPVERALVFHADAVPRYVTERYAGLFAPVYAQTQLALPFRAVMPSITPVCFASMYAGTDPQTHGVDRFFQPILSERLVQPSIWGDTIVDALVRAGRRVAVVTCSDGCIASMLYGRGAQLYIIPGDDDQAMYEKALEVVRSGNYDVVFLYQLSYDAAMHRCGPESPESLEVLDTLAKRFEVLARTARQSWSGHSLLTVFNTDHGAHLAPDGGHHGEDIPQDMELTWFFGAYPGTDGICGDPELDRLIAREEGSQRETISLIASESLQSPALLRLNGCAFNARTAVGLPGRQRLGGCEGADELEKLACRRACDLFGAEHANVLPVSGSAANLAAMTGVLKKGDRVLALDPELGSHTSHGSPKHITSQLYDFTFVGLERDSCLIDYDELEQLARRLQPRLILLGASAYPRVIDFERVSHIARENSALLMADMAHMMGLVAARAMPSPLPYADIVTGSATKTLCGPHAGFLLCRDALADRVDAGVYPMTTASVHLQSVAAMAYTFREAGTPAFRETMERTVSDARQLAASLTSRGFGVLTGGTDCHFFIADLRPLGLDARMAAELLQSVGLTVNTKGIPYEKGPAQGLRIGTTVCAQRGMGPAEMEILAEVISLVGSLAGANTGDLFAAGRNKEILYACRSKIHLLTERFPLPW